MVHFFTQPSGRKENVALPNTLKTWRNKDSSLGYRVEAMGIQREEKGTTGAESPLHPNGSTSPVH
jgi:hypothetical protein